MTRIPSPRPKEITFAAAPERPAEEGTTNRAGASTRRNVLMPGTINEAIFGASPGRAAGAHFDTGISAAATVRPPSLRSTFLAVAALLAGSAAVSAQSYNLVAFAGGSGPQGLDMPGGVAVDSRGKIYVSSGHSIVTVASDGSISAFAGLSETFGSVDGTGRAARFNRPSQLAVDRADNLYVADTYNHTIRRITPAGVVSTIAGVPGEHGTANGPATAALLSFPHHIAVDDSGNVFVSETMRIRKIDAAGGVTTFAGPPTNTYSLDNPPPRFGDAAGLAVDSAGNVYVADELEHTIRRVTPAGVITTVAGSASRSGISDGLGREARFLRPSALAFDRAGNLFVADTGNHTIRKITPSGEVTTLLSAAGGAERPGLLHRVAVDRAGDIYTLASDRGFLYRTRPINELQVTLPPTSTQSAASGHRWTLSTTVTGLEPITYQWFKDGALIPGATLATFTRPTAQVADTGSYTLTARNAAGTITSPPAKLVIKPPYRLTELGTLDRADRQVVPTGLNAAGHVVGRVNRTDNTTRAFLFSDGTMSDLGHLGGTNSQAFAINAGGQIVGVSQLRDGSTHAFLHSGRTLQDLGTLGGRSSAAYAINDAGDIVGSSDVGRLFFVGLSQLSEYHAFLYSAGAMTDLGSVRQSSFAKAINAAGQIAGTAVTGSGGTATWLAYDGFLLSDRRVTMIPQFPSLAPWIYSSSIAGIDASGGVVGSAANNTNTGPQAFRFDNGQMRELGAFSAHAVNNVGQIAGTFLVDAINHACLYENGSLIDLNGLVPDAPDWVLDQALALNDRGQIAGTSGGRAFLLTPISEAVGGLANVSVLAEVTPADPLIAGVVVRSAAAPVLARAIGPALRQFLPGGTIPVGDPRLELYRGTTLIQSNDNWDDNRTLEDAFRAVGAFPLASGSLDAAIRHDISGAATAHLLAPTSGLALLEIWGPGSATAGAPRLANLSVRHRLSRPGASLGIELVVDGSGPTTVLVRGIGPALAAPPFNLKDVLEDPKIELFDRRGLKLAANEDWAPAAASTFADVGAFPLPAGSKDAALVITLVPGIYSVRVGSANGGTGVALAEAYEILGK